MPTTQPTELPITDMLEKIQSNKETTDFGKLLMLIETIPQVRSLEQSQIQKAKEDERNIIKNEIYGFIAILSREEKILDADKQKEVLDKIYDLFQ